MAPESFSVSIHADGFTNPGAAELLPVLCLINRELPVALPWQKYLSDRETGPDEVAPGRRPPTKIICCNRSAVSILGPPKRTPYKNSSLALEARIFLGDQASTPRLPQSRNAEQSRLRGAHVTFRFRRSQVETSFITSPEEQRLLRTAAFRSENRHRYLLQWHHQLFPLV